MLDNQTQEQDKKKGTERVQRSKAFSKTQEGYWRERIRKRTFKNKEGERESNEFYLRIKEQGRSYWINLQTANRDIGAKVARDKYLQIMANGVEDVLKPKPKPSDDKTIGEYLQCAERKGKWDNDTYASYVRKFRTLISQMFKIKVDSSEKYNPKGSAVLRDRVNKVKLKDVTLDRILEWRANHISKAGEDQAKRILRTNGANATLRNAKALFKKELRESMPEFKIDGNFPLLKIKTTHDVEPYRSRFDHKELLRKARADLSITFPEQFKILLLGIGASLRRNEIDKLKWESIDFERNQIHIVAHESFAPKSKASAGAVNIDAQLSAELKRFYTNPKDFVIKQVRPARKTPKHSVYRVATHFKYICKWLEESGVPEKQKIHTLRKEGGRLVNEKSGLVATQKFLRHGDPSVTGKYYSDDKRIVTTGIGELIAMPQEETLPQKAQEPLILDNTSFSLPVACEDLDDFASPFAVTF